MHSQYTLIIPTRDSGKWAGVFLEKYRDAGIEPLYIVDSRSSDKTLEELGRRKARLVEFKPKKNFAEAGMVEFGSSHAGTKWVLRLDDDEFPSRSLLDWLKNATQCSSINCWAISRRDVSFIAGQYVYSSWPTRYGYAENFRIFNPQMRFFQPEKVIFVEKVHTPGFIVPQEVGFAPNDSYFIHCNNLVRTLAERIEKVRRYAQHDTNLSWGLIDESLPEWTTVDIHQYSTCGLIEFFDLFSKLPILSEGSQSPFDCNEMDLFYQNSQKIFAQLLTQARARVLDYEEASEDTFYYLPPPVLKFFAEACLTIGRLTGHAQTNQLGKRLWRLMELKTNKARCIG